MNRKKNGKQKRKKPKYGLFSCVVYVYTFMWKYERMLAWTAFLIVPISLLISLIGLYTPAIIIYAVEKCHAFSTVGLIIAGLLLTNLIMSVINLILNANIENAEHFLLLRMQYNRNVYLRNRDFYLAYEPEVHELDMKAECAIQNNHSAGVHFPMDFASMVVTILNFLCFGTVISTLNPWIVLLLSVGCIINYLISKWERNANYGDRDIRDSLRKKTGYLAWTVSRDIKYGKDIRLYNLADYLNVLMKKLLAQEKCEQEKVENRGQINALVSFLVVLVRDGLSYTYLINKAISGELDVASFVLYFSAITSMAGFMGNILSFVGRIQDGAIQISDYREGFDTINKLNHQAGIPLPNNTFSIEFKNVSYKYPLGEKLILDNVSFKIEPGEKVALVGLNGAGKTTLIKLACGLILPNEGDVLLNGHSVLEYNCDELYKLFSLIPQRYSILPLSLERNITCSNEEDMVNEDKLWRCIETAGLSEKIHSLPNGVKTLLNRQVNHDGIDLSGGEVLKLLLARAMYREPLCLILDEPTAAFDPIAEDRIYRKYNEISNNVTSIFISHRLASTRFCDRIFFLEDAKIAEEGTHESLMAKGGKYKELFDIQSQYYNKGGEGDEK